MDPFSVLSEDYDIVYQPFSSKRMEKQNKTVKAFEKKTRRSPRDFSP